MLTYRGPLLALTLVPLLACAMTAGPSGSSVIVLAGGGLGGSTYATLTGFSYIIRKHAGLDVRVVPSGGLISLVKVGRNDVQGAIGNRPFLRFALEGLPPFDRAYPNVRTVMHGGGGLNLAHVVAAREVPLESLADLTATRYPLRIGVDRKGTTDNWIFTEMLAYYGISASHIEAWGGSVREVGYAEQTRLLTDGHIDAVFQNSQVPSSSLIEASYRRALRFLALPPDLVAHMTDLGWVAQEIPRGGYDRVGGTGAIVSVGYMMPFIVNAEMSEDVVYAIVRALCTHPEETRSVHRSWRQFDPRTAWKDTGGELHPGAVRFFREEGYLNQ